MTKTPLSSDLDLVKEIEQLRIKQKLLLQAFKDKDVKEDQEQLLQSIFAQVQFLVEIFKEETTTDKGVEEEVKNNQTILIDKIESIKIAVFERMDLLEKKIDAIESKPDDSSLERMLGVTSEGNLEEDSNIISEAEVEDVFGEKDSAPITHVPLSETNENSSSISSSSSPSLEEIPTPDFKVTAEEPQKKGWFSK
jgi:hypothetical protein